MPAWEEKLKQKIRQATRKKETADRLRSIDRVTSKFDIQGLTVRQLKDQLLIRRHLDGIMIKTDYKKKDDYIAALRAQILIENTKKKWIENYHVIHYV